MIDIDLDDLNEDDVYKAFGVDGNEGEALNDIYLELYELIGKEGMLKLFKYFRGIRSTAPCGSTARSLSLIWQNRPLTGGSGPRLPELPGTP